jgi:glutathionylspermidine synthase
VRRLAITPRPDWQQKVEKYGFYFHTLRGEPYWDESACYTFTAAEIELIADATDALHGYCLDLVAEVVEKRLFAPFLIPKEFEDYVVKSWEAKEPSVYGRFDLAYDGVNPPKMLEYNADTPTALLEASIIQWDWVKERGGDQFNEIHDKLLSAWRKVKAYDPGPVHFAALAKRENIDTPEDYITAEYMRDVAIQSGFNTAFLDVTEIGYDHVRQVFVDQTGFPIHRCYKLYPWEWIAREEFAPHVLTAPTRWVEPAWKMILSCKSILPLLYERHPDSPYLLPAAFDPLPGGNFVRKPIHAREGSNIQVVLDGNLALETDGPYTEGPFVYQGVAPLKPHDGRFPVIGSWVVDGLACGIGIREDGSLVTSNTSRFVPHQMVD